MRHWEHELRALLEMSAPGGASPSAGQGQGDPRFQAAAPFESQTNQPAARQRGLSEDQLNTFQTVSDGLLMAASSFDQPTDIQVLPSPYKGQQFSMGTNPGQASLMELLNYLAQRGVRG